MTWYNQLYARLKDEILYIFGPNAARRSLSVDLLSNIGFQSYINIQYYRFIF